MVKVQITFIELTDGITSIYGQFTYSVLRPSSGFQSRSYVEVPQVPCRIYVKNTDKVINIVIGNKELLASRQPSRFYNLSYANFCLT